MGKAVRISDDEAMKLYEALGEVFANESEKVKGGEGCSGAGLAK